MYANNSSFQVCLPVSITKMDFVFNLFVPILVFYSGMSCIFVWSTLPAILTVLAVSILLYFKNQPPPVENVEAVLGSSKIQIIAHRGGAHDAPENTLEAIEQVCI